MRQGNGNDGIVMNDVAECAGLHLRADYCSEHEWGIKGLRRKFGIDNEKLGIEKRRIANDGGVYLVEFTKKKEKCAFLTNFKSYKSIGYEKTPCDWNDAKQYVTDRRWFDLEHNEQSEGIAGAWDEDNFIAVVKGTKNINHLKDVYEAFQKNNIAIFLGGGSGPFMNAGLSIAIIDQLPAEIAKDMLNIDMIKINLDKAVKATGIEKKLDKAGLKYFALSPEWNDPESPSDGIKFWLNPSDQVNHNHGWYSVEQLEEWIDGKGPIIKKAPTTVPTKPQSIEFTDENGNLIV